MPELYDAYYYATGCGEPYERNESWLRFFGSIADRIISDIGPATALDAGCALGFLVETLRERGVRASGVDISEFAIASVHPSIQPFCWVGSLADPLPQRYDLVVTIEVLEHISAADGERAIANLCLYTDDILFSSTPFDYKEATHCNVQPPEYWAERFARHGFYRDVEFDAAFITPWAARFRKSREPVSRTIAAYERRWWQLQQDNQARRLLNVEQRNALAAREQEFQVFRGQAEQEVSALNTQLRNWEMRWSQLERSPGWTLLRALQMGRARFAPPGSTRDQTLEDVWRALRTRQLRPFRDALRRVGLDISWRTHRFRWQRRLKTRRTTVGYQFLQVDAVAPRPALQIHSVPVEIIVCVHNALDAVQQCLESIVYHTMPPYTMILVDDGSDAETRDYLNEFAQLHGAVLLRNEHALGYTFAANEGLRGTSAEYVVLLNSDTIVTSEWLDRMIACAESHPRIGLVGPLSNTASWQSIPDIESQGDWATNPLPAGMSVEEMGQLVARHSSRLYPPMPLLNGFCLLLRRGLIEDIGYFDEESFGAGYGEEDDYALRAREAGWTLALADDVYIYHAQSRSYSIEKRKALCDRAGAVLARKHGQQIVEASVAICRQDRVLEGIRARSRVMPTRQEWIAKGRARYARCRVLYLLPIVEPGGGGNVIFYEAQAMRQMGVEVAFFNLATNRPGFERSYPDFQLPIIYGNPEDIAVVARDFDALIATVNFTAEWLTSVVQRDGRPVRGYYVQGFEPLIYKPGSEDYRRALASYTLFPDLVLFTKTDWTREQVSHHTEAQCALVGVSLDTDLFRPRPQSNPESPARPLRIAAMVRVSTPYREPKLTMEILKRAAQRYGSNVEILTFGTALDDPRLSELPHDFAWKAAGILPPEKVAVLLNEADVFVDFSSHQAMGLTALEAMACGAAVIVPRRGGASTFVRDGENGLVVDTTSGEDCWLALKRLIDEHDLRVRLQANALVDVCQYSPERPAYSILNELFVSASSSQDR
jgi:GT2 family glycosyltransferase